MLLFAQPNFKTFISVLKKPWYSGCPVGKLPLMPIEKSRRAEILFTFLFFFIFLNQIFVVEPVLDVYYFMISTTMCMTKLGFVFWALTRNQKPGYVERDSELNWVDVMKKVPSVHLCPDCKIIRPPRSHHCNICNKCVDRFEAHSVWTNSCVGRSNAYLYFMFIFYVWLNTFLIGWISMDSIPVVHCEKETGCVYRSLCVGCDNELIHYFVTWFDMIVCFFYLVPSTYHLWI